MCWSEISFVGRQGGRLCRTGDRVRWQDHGVLEFLGHLDHQVKIRGHRIELGEIEAALGEYRGACVAVVIRREDVPGDVLLVAYLVAADPDAEPLSRELKEYLREHLPEAILPLHFIALERFPHTSNENIDRKALPARMDAKPRTKTGDGGGAPASELEAKVRAAWQEVLQLLEIDIEDNFFDLGGHSLLAVKVHRRLNETLERSLAITDLFRFPTFKSLAAYISDGGAGVSLQGSQDRAAIRRPAMAARRGARGKPNQRS